MNLKQKLCHKGSKIPNDIKSISVKTFKDVTLSIDFTLSNSVTNISSYGFINANLFNWCVLLDKKNIKISTPIVRAKVSKKTIKKSN